MELRVTANLAWDITAESFEDGHQKAIEFLNKIIGDNEVKRSVSLSIISKSKSQDRLAVFRPDEVLPFVTSSNGRRTFKISGSEFLVKMNSDRYHLFKKSLECVSCGLVGSLMALELAPGTIYPHFNLYAMENGREVLMTKDHIKPVAKGGGNKDSNFQVMCCICNNIKGDSSLTIEKIKELREIHNFNITKLSASQFASVMREEKKKRISKTKGEIMKY